MKLEYIGSRKEFLQELETIMQNYYGDNQRESVKGLRLRMLAKEKIAQNFYISKEADIALKEIRLDVNNNEVYIRAEYNNSDNY